MNLDQDPDLDSARAYIDAHTLIRKIELFDPTAVTVQRTARLAAADRNGLQFTLATRQLPNRIPDGWQVEPVDELTVKVSVASGLDVLFPDFRVSRVSSAGQLPTGFDPGALYASRHHPRGLQLTIYGASDALKSTGIPLEEIKRHVQPDQMAVYSGSAMGQLDTHGYGGMMQSPMMGKRPTSKNAALGLSEMPGDFINAYVLGSVGGTAGIIGACATFLYNVKQGIDDITAGRKRVVMVGNSEAPVLPEVIEAYRVMGALAEDEALMALDGRDDEPDYRRACRPFSDNCGFTVAEGSVYAMIMDDELAIELGARILGSVPGVFVNADGYKKSIPGPGIGNYLTVAKAMSLANAMLGETGLAKRTHMLAHGTGTPQNRVTESHILNEFARLHGIDRWPVSAIKAYIGHSMAPAGGDQLAVALGVWEHGWLPGITTIDHIADDVHQTNLCLPLQHLELGAENVDAAFVNSKGFGGNNATGLFLSPDQTKKMLEKRWGRNAMSQYRKRNRSVEQSAHDYDQAMDRGEVHPIYRFGEGVLKAEDLGINRESIAIPGYDQAVDLTIANPYEDMFPGTSA